MKKFKGLYFSVGILLIILIFALVRISNPNLFKQDSTKAIEAAKEGKNSISIAELNKLSSEYLVLDLSSLQTYNPSQFKNSIHIPFENLLDKKNQKSLKDLNGKIILYSADISTASKAWVILNQLGFSTVFILETETNPEHFKYKFQPDTTAKLE